MISSVVVTRGHFLGDACYVGRLRYTVLTEVEIWPKISVSRRHSSEILSTSATCSIYIDYTQARSTRKAQTSAKADHLLYISNQFLNCILASYIVHFFVTSIYLEIIVIIIFIIILQNCISYIFFSTTLYNSLERSYS